MALTSYIKNVWSDRLNRRFLLCGIGISLVQFIVFKVLYPYPDFFSDSYSYLEAAYSRLDVSIWPIGYSKFLWLVHHITRSDTALISIQYLLLQLSLFHLFFTIRYFYQVGKTTDTILFLFLFVNPLSLYLCNYINSDPLFASLSIFWLVQLIWISKHPRIYQIFIQATLLFLCFTIRNNAYYYPLVAAVFFYFSRQSLVRRIAGIVMPLLLLVPFIVHTENEALKKTGTRQFSLFTGWQLANNALYIYDKVEVDSNDLLTPQAKELNEIAIGYFRHIKSEAFHEYLDSYVGNYFIRQPEAPLKTYYNRHYNSPKDTDIVRSWGRASADFEPFGRAIILRHPFTYIQYFILPNIGHYFLPPLSHLERYNYGQEKIYPIAAYWFHYPSTKVRCFSYNIQQFLIIYEALFALFNVYFFWQFIRLLFEKWSKDMPAKQPVEYWLISLFFLLNFGFSITTTENILRYQYVPMVILLSFSFIIKDWLEKNTVNENEVNSIRSTKQNIESAGAI